MSKPINITLTLDLLVDAAWDEDAIVTHVRTCLPRAFGEALTALKNPVDILDVREVRDGQP